MRLRGLLRNTASEGTFALIMLNGFGPVSMAEFAAESVARFTEHEEINGWRTEWDIEFLPGTVVRSIPCRPRYMSDKVFWDSRESIALSVGVPFTLSTPHHAKRMLSPGPEGKVSRVDPWGGVISEAPDTETGREPE